MDPLATAWLASNRWWNGRFRRLPPHQAAQTPRSWRRLRDLDSLPDLTEALAYADPELRRRVFDAFRLAVALDRNARQIRVKALTSSAFTKTRDL
jgi:hypothetical protein